MSVLEILRLYCATNVFSVEEKRVVELFNQTLKDFKATVRNLNTKYINQFKYLNNAKNVSQNEWQSLGYFLNIFSNEMHDICDFVRNRINSYQFSCPVDTCPKEELILFCNILVPEIKSKTENFEKTITEFMTTYKGN